MRSQRIGLILMVASLGFDGRVEAQSNTPGGDRPLTAIPRQLTPNPVEQTRADYVLGPNDQILIRASQVDEIGQRPYRIDTQGDIDLPLIGTVKAGSLRVDQLEAELVNRLVPYVRIPQVSVTVVEYRSEPVFFTGAFRTPGIYSLEGRRTLAEMLAGIGGLQPNASRRVTITRRLDYGSLALPNAVVDKASNTSTAEIGMSNLRENGSLAEDIVLQPYDRISAVRAEMVFVTGEVGRSGGFELEERESISVVQLLSLSGGLTHDADPEKARVLRPVLNTSKREEIPLNLKLVLAGRADDYPLMENDVLYVPRKRSVMTSVGRASLILVPVVSSVVIYTAIR